MSSCLNVNRVPFFLVLLRLFVIDFCIYRVGMYFVCMHARVCTCIYVCVFVCVCLCVCVSARLKMNACLFSCFSIGVLVVIASCVYGLSYLTLPFIHLFLP